jgi:hypothetical protein
MRVAWPLLVALALGCAPALPEPADAGPSAAHPEGLGTDEAQVAACLACHPEVSAAWAKPSSHKLLLGCAGCHDGHASTAACSSCHSSVSHPAEASCTSCHDPHGSANLYGVRESLTRPDRTVAKVEFGLPEGAAALGLVRSGGDGGVAGAGLCETCHRYTRYFRGDGGTAPHASGWCARCHSHAQGFQPVN